VCKKKGGIPVKIAYFELIVELEDVLEKKLRDSFGQEYSLFLNPEGDSLLALEKGVVSYDAIEIFHLSEKFSSTQNSEQFWEMIKIIERKEKINKVYQYLQKKLKDSSPELFNEELDIPKSYRTYSEFIISFIFIFIISFIIFLLR
jgi:hypothetical protein